MLQNIRMHLAVLVCISLGLNTIQGKEYSCDSRVGCGCSKVNANVSARIVGGETAVTNSWGWAVSLRDTSGRSFCGGTVLSDLYVLTAAHCVDDLDFQVSAYSVEVGTNLIQQGLGQVISLSAIYLHPRYNTITNENDIAILRLSRPINFADRSATRLCLPNVSTSQQSRYPVVEEPLIAIGWGRLSSGGSSTFSLRQVTLYSVSSSDSKCSPSLNNNNLQFCAAVPGGGKDTCQGDSGGPIMRYSTKDQVWVLAGITSYGRGCALANHAGVYTRVSAYLDWIRSITGASGFTAISQGISPDGSGLSNAVIASQLHQMLFILLTILSMLIHTQYHM